MRDHRLFTFRHGSWICTPLAVLVCLFVAAPAIAGIYLSTKHGNSTSGVDRNNIGVNSDVTFADYSVGNCAHCHESHASVDSAEPAPPATEGATDNALFRSNYGATDRNQLCYHCHETFSNLGGLGSALKYGRYEIYQGQVIYEDSSHNTSANANWPAGVSPVPVSDDAGNCNNCHDPHGVDNGSGSPIPSLTRKKESDLCLVCHDGSPAADNISSDVTDTYGHHVGNYTGVHDVSTEYNAINTTEHVECVDCHNPHAAADTEHSTGTNAIASTSPLYGTLGAAQTYSGASNWSTPTQASYAIQPATKEYEICFKCHSGANSNWSGWDDTGAGAWTDVGLEFNPNNNALHPITMTLNDAPNTEALDSAQLIAPWQANRGNQTMYCSDCHASDSTVAGPHGSSVKWMLAGANKAWPFDSASKNGSNSTTATDYRVLNNTLGGTDGYNDGLGTANGLFCRNCHPNTNAAGNDAHAEHDTRTSICVICHIRVPHGSKVSSFIAATGDASGTGWGNLPARYRPNGDGSGPANARMYRFRKTTATSYSKSNCRADGDSGRGGDDCGDHSGQLGSTPYETW